MNERMETKGQGGKRRRAVVWVVVLVVALVLAGVGVAWGVAAHRGSRLAEARSACAQASDTLRVARNQYDMYHADEAKTAAALTGKDTGDEKVVKTLAAEYDAQVPELVACNTKDAAELDRRTEVIRRDADWYGTHLTALKAATGKVNDATHAKQVKDAKGALDKKLSAARKLLKDSDGRVADTKTRDALSKAIDTADKARDSKDVKALKDRAAALSKAMDAVNSSVKKKADADRKVAEAEQARREQEAAAAAAAAEQAQQQAQQYTAPAAPQYTAPQTATPQPSAPQPQATTPSTPSAPSSGSTSSGSSGGGDGGVYFNPNSGGQGCGPDFCGGTYDGINHNGF
ncbi:MAG: hypothetical protein MR429_06240 [Bifidobacterium animalis]|nr:hypothetical protein [Bifidobacterium animalis]